MALDLKDEVSESNPMPEKRVYSPYHFPQNTQRDTARRYTNTV